MRLLIKLHSVSDIITNSSSETFIVKSDKEKSDLENFLREIIDSFHYDSNHCVVDIMTPLERAKEDSMFLSKGKYYTVEDICKRYPLTLEQFNGVYIIDLDQCIGMDCISYICSILSPLYISQYMFRCIDGRILPIDNSEALELLTQGNHNVLSGMFIDTDGNAQEDLLNEDYIDKYVENEELNNYLSTLNK